MPSTQSQPVICAALLLGLVACDHAVAPPMGDELPAELPAAQTSIADAPTFTPYTIEPELANAAEVIAALGRNYPPLLRDAGIEGTAMVWLFIDRTGAVAKVQLRETSGYAALDEAAESVAGTMRFEPALDGSQPVAVWVALPIRFAAASGT
ncbi:MAG: energy transducer TonB [Planctomycetaceae bacterium]